MKLYRIAKVERPMGKIDEQERKELAEKASRFSSPDEFIESVMPEYAKYDSEDDFMEYHRTGGIPSDAYENYERPGGLSWMGGTSEYPQLIDTFETPKGTIEIRKTGKKNQYVKWIEGEIARGDDGMVLMRSDDEVVKAGLPLYDTAIAAFHDGKPVALVSDEFGSDGVWVEREFQGIGLGTALLHEFRKQFKPTRQIGQMTPAGDAMSRKLYRRMEQRANELMKIWEEEHN